MPPNADPAAVLILGFSATMAFLPPILIAVGLAHVDALKGSNFGLNIGGIMLAIVLAIAYWISAGYTVFSLSK
jgi:hypothetical protein